MNRRKFIAIAAIPGAAGAAWTGRSQEDNIESQDRILAGDNLSQFRKFSSPKIENNELRAAIMGSDTMVVLLRHRKRGGTDMFNVGFNERKSTKVSRNIEVSQNVFIKLNQVADSIR